MKKLLIIAMVFVLAGTVSATVTITAVQREGTKLVDINYNVTSEPNLVRAFALDITVSDGNIVDINNYFVGENNSVKKGYGIFPGTITIDAQGVITSYGSPVAPASDPCAKGTVGGNGVTIEMGSLYLPGKAPANSGTLCTLQVNKSCNLCVNLNTRRRGIVLENPAATVSTNLPVCAAVTVQSACPCPGDIAHSDMTAGPDGIVDSGDLYYFITVLFTTYPDDDPTGRYILPIQGLECFDIAHSDMTAGPDGIIDSGDLYYFITIMFTEYPDDDPTGQYYMPCSIMDPGVHPM